MAAYYKVEVSLGTNAVEVGIPSPQSVNVVLPLIGPQGAVGATGPTGSTGPANSLAIGAVTTGAEGSAAAAAITGTAPSQTLSLAIPVGATGATGPAGTATTDASLLTSGTLADARLSGNVPLEDAANTFSANQTLNGTNNTAPNQTAASSSSLMTRSLVALEQISPRTIILRDDFLVATATAPGNTTAGELRWGWSNQGTPTTSWQSGIAATSYGVARFATATTTDDYITVAIAVASNAANRSPLAENDFTFVIRVALPSIADIEFRAGLLGSNARNFFGAAFGGNSGGQFVRFESATDSNWTLVSGGSGGSSGNTVATTVAPVAGTFYNLAVRKSGSTLYLSVDEGTEVSVAVAANNGDQIAMGVRTKTGASKSFDVDFVGFYSETSR